MKQLWDIIRIIEKALQHNDEGVKAYARRLATKYRQEGDNNFTDCILSAIGEKTVPMATMDDNSGQMTPKDAVKFLRQIYPYGGHCWLDDQRTRAIEMAIDVLEKQEEASAEEPELFARLLSHHDETGIFPLKKVDRVFEGKPSDPDILTVVLKDGQRHFCDEVEITE